MAVLITTNTQKKLFSQDVIKIGSTKECDFFINNIGKENLVLQFSKEKNKYILVNRNINII